MATTWVIDALNVIGSRPDGWWRDRHGAIVGLVAELRMAATIDDRIVVVIDGHQFDAVGPAEPPRFRIEFASRSGPDGADDRIVKLLETGALDGPPIMVVTSDRALRDRVTRLGATTVGPRTFRDRLAAGNDRAWGPNSLE